MGSVPSVLLSRGCVWTALSILWLPNTRKTWNKSSGCHKNSLGLENITYRRKLKELGLFSLGKVLNICPCKARMTWSDDHCLKQTLGQRPPEIPPSGSELWCSDWNKHAKRNNSPGEDVLWIRCYLLSPRHVCVCRNWWDPEDLPPPTLAWALQGQEDIWRCTAGVSTTSCRNTGLILFQAVIMLLSSMNYWQMILKSVSSLRVTHCLIFRAGKGDFKYN